MDASSLLTGIAALILLAVTAMRFGVDSRECLRSKERDLASFGIVWDRSPAPRTRLRLVGAEQERPRPTG